MEQRPSVVLESPARPKARSRESTRVPSMCSARPRRRPPSPRWSQHRQPSRPRREEARELRRPQPPATSESCCSSRHTSQVCPLRLSRMIRLHPKPRNVNTGNAYHIPRHREDDSLGLPFALPETAHLVARRQKMIQRAFGLDPAVVQHENPVSALQRWPPMRHDQTGLR